MGYWKSASRPPAWITSLTWNIPHVMVVAVLVIVGMMVEELGSDWKIQLGSLPHLGNFTRMVHFRIWRKSSDMQPWQCGHTKDQARQRERP